jgi:hypothetical protein
MAFNPDTAPEGAFLRNCDEKIYVLTAFNFNDGEKITPSLQAFTVWKMQLRTLVR